MKFYSYICLFALSLILPVTMLSAADTVVIEDNREKYPLGKNLYILEDPLHEHSIESIQAIPPEAFKKSTEDVPYFGFTNSTIWVRCSIRNQSTANSKWLLEFSYPLMDNISFFFPGKDKKYSVIKTGYRHAFNTRPVQHRHFIFPVEFIYDSEIVFYMRFRNEDRMEIPLALWNSVKFRDKSHTEQYIMGIYFGILFFMLLFNFSFFLSIKDRSYFYYILFLFCYSFYQLTQNGYMFEYFTPGFLEAYTHTIPLTICLGLITLMIFTISFLSTKELHPKCYRVFLILIIILAATLPTQIFLPYAVSILVQLGLSFFVIGTILYTGIVLLIKRYRPAFFFIIAWSALLVGALIYASKVAGILPSNFFANYALQIGSIFHFTLLSFGLGDRVTMLRKEGEEAQKQALFSKVRFNLLVGNSDDIIFTLDKNWNFMSANKSIRKHFRISPEEVKEKNIIDLVFEERRGGSVTKILLREKLENFAETREPIVFRVPFMSSIITEPKEMQVRLEYINIKGKQEILGKASHIPEDTLLKYFQSEKQSFCIGNYLITAEDITHRITRNITKHLEQKKVNLLRIALREIIINAIEHGNLEINFEEKTAAQIEDRYFELVSERQNDSRYANRQVSIDYTVNNEKAVYYVTDEGNGFNHKEFITNAAAEANRELLAHGRGLAMAKSIFDEIEFNEKGNRVMLVKNFPGGTEAGK
ncbi:MAG: PAS domain-containing protein [bacterium]|nr:PAS domain-containing protein [bacterium]